MAAELKLHSKSKQGQDKESTACFHIQTLCKNIHTSYGISILESHEQFPNTDVTDGWNHKLQMHHPCRVFPYHSLVAWPLLHPLPV